MYGCHVNSEYREKRKKKRATCLYALSMLCDMHVNHSSHFCKCIQFIIKLALCLPGDLSTGSRVNNSTSHTCRTSSHLCVCVCVCVHHRCLMCVFYDGATPLVSLMEKLPPNCPYNDSGRLLQYDEIFISFNLSLYYNCSNHLDESKVNSLLSVGRSFFSPFHPPSPTHEK